MNHICTWLCVDEKGEESHFPQTGQLSSSQSHQNIYWRCVLVYFITSKRFNKSENHILFTNVQKLPVVDGKAISKSLMDLGVEIVFTDFRYKTPKGYYKSFQNQFYEFSILEHISKNNSNNSDMYLILDSDCIFIKPAAELFKAAKERGFISFQDNVLPDYVINGLSRNDLKSLYEELLEQKINEMPSYHLGEFFLASVVNIRKFYYDFLELWPQLLERHTNGKQKFNEEAHTLSYLYFKNGFRASTDEHFMKRIWSNPLFYRNVEPKDTELAIWHLPSEKTFGIFRLYECFMNKFNNYGFDLSNDYFNTLVQKTLGVPHLGLKMRLEYYIVSYYRAIRKKVSKISLLSK